MQGCPILLWSVTSLRSGHNYTYQLFDALDFLHSRANLIHSDLKRELVCAAADPVLVCAAADPC